MRPHTAHTQYTQPTHNRDVYLVYDLMDTDLHQIIRSPQPLSEDHISYFTYQVCVYGLFSSVCVNVCVMRACAGCYYQEASCVLPYTSSGHTQHSQTRLHTNQNTKHTHNRSCAA